MLKRFIVRLVVGLLAMTALTTASATSASAASEAPGEPGCYWYMDKWPRRNCSGRDLYRAVHASTSRGDRVALASAMLAVMTPYSSNNEVKAGLAYSTGIFDTIDYGCARGALLSFTRDSVRVKKNVAAVSVLLAPSKKVAWDAYRRQWPNVAYATWVNNVKMVAGPTFAAAQRAALQNLAAGYATKLVSCDPYA